jgi:hypothetical protein
MLLSRSASGPGANNNNILLSSRASGPNGSRYSY